MVLTGPFIKKVTALLLTLWLCGCSINSPRKRYVLAEKLWAEGQYAAAVVEFDRVTAKDPRGKLGLRALYRSASTRALFLDQPVEAIKKLQEYADAPTENPLSWEARKQIGELLFLRLEHYRDAIFHYRKMLSIQPDSPDAPMILFQIGKSYFYLWEFGDALVHYREIIRRFPKTEWAEKAAYEIGTTYYTEGEKAASGKAINKVLFQQAIDAYQKFLKDYPDSSKKAEAQFGVASCYEELDRLDEAYALFESLKQSYPSPKVITIKLTRIKERKSQRSHD